MLEYFTKPEKKKKMQLLLFDALIVFIVSHFEFCAPERKVFCLAYFTSKHSVTSLAGENMQKLLMDIPDSL